jgi:uncharacterized protein
LARNRPRRGTRRASNPAPPATDDAAPRAGLTRLYIACFILLCIVGGTAVWLALGEAPVNPGISLALDQPAPRQVEELIPPNPDSAPLSPAVLPPETAPPLSGALRVLPAETSPEGKIRLAPVPDPLLVEQTTIGPLPRIAEDGAQSFRLYAHPAPPADGRPRVAIVITSMGLRETPTRLAIERLPPQLSLGFTPYGEHLQDWVSEARLHGHEVLLELPTEPYDYPENDPGPHALLTGLSAEENTGRLEWLLSRFSGYVGVVNFIGAKFSTSETALGPVMAELKGRGLMIVDNQLASHSRIADMAAQISLPFAAARSQIDADLSAAAIDAKLAELEKEAAAKGHAVGLGLPLPLTIERVAIWAAQLEEKGITLAPVSAVATDGN